MSSCARPTSTCTDGVATPRRRCDGDAANHGGGVGRRALYVAADRAVSSPRRRAHGPPPYRPRAPRDVSCRRGRCRRRADIRGARVRQSVSGRAVSASYLLAELRTVTQSKATGLHLLELVAITIQLGRPPRRVVVIRREDTGCAAQPAA